jgi:subtilisin family serine protease
MGCPRLARSALLARRLRHARTRSALLPARERLDDVLSDEQQEIAMRRLSRSAVFGLTLATVLLGGPGRLAAAEAGVSAVDRYIVVFQPTVADAGLATTALSRLHGVTPTHVYKHALKGFAAPIPQALVATLRADPRVRFVAPDREVRATAQVAPTGIQRAGASTDGVHQTLTNKGAGIGVAVIDTGIALDHPDLAANIAWESTTCVPGTLNAYDDYGHGTHVSGTIAALDNDIGVFGMAPQATLYAVKVLGFSGIGLSSWVICGIDWVTANAKYDDGTQRIHVANMSLGGSGSSDNNCGRSNGDAQHLAICNSTAAGVTYVVAAGNDGVDATNSAPASYDDTLITVSALADSDGKPGGLGPGTSRGGDDDFANFSNYGRQVAIGAPGVNILSTVPVGICSLCSLSGYATASGTSMATPHVAGAVALYLATHPGARWTDVRTGLRAQGEQLSDRCTPSAIGGACHIDSRGVHPEPVLRVSGL